MKVFPNQWYVYTPPLCRSRLVKCLGTPLSEPVNTSGGGWAKRVGVRDMYRKDYQYYKVYAAHLQPLWRILINWISE